MAQIRYLVVVAALIGVVSVPLVSGAQASTPDLQAAQQITIPVQSGPFGVAIVPSRNEVLVTNRYANSISVISTLTNTVTKTISAGKNPLYIVPWPGSQYPDTFYVSNEFGQSISVLNAANNTVQNTFNNVGQNLHGIGIDTVRNLMYVAGDESNDVYVINAQTGSPVATIPGFDGAYGLAYDAYRNQIFVSNAFTNTVSVINGATGQIATTLTVGNNPYDVQWYPGTGPGSDRVFVANEGSNTVSIIDPSTDTVEATTLPTDNQPQMLGLDIPNGRLLVTTYSQCTLEVFDLRTGQKLGPSISVGHNPQGVAVDSAANVAYVANSVDNTVSVVPLPAVSTSPTSTPTTTPTSTSTSTPTPTDTATATGTATSTPSSTPTPTGTPKPTMTATQSPTASPTFTPMSTSSSTPVDPTATPTATATATVGQNGTPDPCANCRIYLPAVYRGQ